MDTNGWQIALVLGGGGALGAFQAGFYEGLHEAGLRPERVAGTSIGAVNGALIAGNPTPTRLARLRAFWDGAADPSFLPLTVDVRRIANALAALRSRLFARPGVYHWTMPDLFFESPFGRPGLYDLTPTGERLAALVDFARIARQDLRLAVNTTDVRTGEAVLFDSGRQQLGVEHVLASAAILPDFPPAELDGRLLCDGGFSANVPLHAVLEEPPDRPTVCIAVDLFGLVREPVLSVDGMLERSDDLVFANQTRTAVTLLRERYECRTRLWRAERAAGLAPDDAGAPAPVVLLVAAYDGVGERIAQKAYDYSARSIEHRWQRGRRHAEAVVAALRGLEAPTPGRLVLERIEPNE